MSVQLADRPDAAARPTPSPPGARGLFGVGLTLLATALLTLAVALVLTGSAPEPAPVGLQSAPLAVLWAARLLHLVTLLAAVVTIGGALSVAGLASGADRRASGRRATVLGAATVALSSVVELGLVVWQASAASPATEYAVLDAVSTAQARGLEAQALLATATALLAVAVAEMARQTVLARGTLVLAVATLVPPLLTGHVLTADQPWLAAASLVAHVVAAAVWTGGLTALGWVSLRQPSAWAESLPRYSRIALVCVSVLVVSGLLNALSRVGSIDVLWTTGYGVLLSLKAILLGGLVGLGALQRRRVVARVDDRRSSLRSFVLIAGAELMFMVLAFALAAALSHTAPPG